MSLGSWREVSSVGEGFSGEEGPSIDLEARMLTIAERLKGQWDQPFLEPKVISFEEARRIASQAATRLEDFLTSIPEDLLSGISYQGRNYVGPFYLPSEDRHEYFTYLYLEFLAERFVITPSES